MAQTALLGETQKSQSWQRGYPLYVGVSYFFQGFYMVGVYIYALTMMANWEVPVRTQAAVIAFLGIPLYLKMFPGLLSDRIPIGRWGRRKPYILGGALLYIPGFVLLLANAQFSSAWMAAILIILFAWMFVDTTLDALIIDVTPEARASQVQGSAWGSRLLGFTLGSLLVPLIGPRIGWTPVLVALGIAALIQSGAALMLREIPVSREALRQEMPISTVFRATFGRPLIWLSILFFLFVSTMSVTRLLNIYLLTELGWNSSPDTMKTYGVVSAVGALASALGALLVMRMPSKWLTSFKFWAGFMAIMWLLTASWLLVYRSPQNVMLIYIARSLVELTSGMSTALLLALTMLVCPKSIEGFTFALMAAVRNFAANAIGPNTATAFSDQLGLVPSIFTLIPYTLISLVFLYPMLKRLNASSVEPALQTTDEVYEVI